MDLMRIPDEKNYLSGIVSFFKAFLLIIFTTLMVVSLKHQTFELQFSTDAISVQFFVLCLGKYICFLFFTLRLILFDKEFRKHFRKYKNELLKSGKSYEFSSLYLCVPSVLNTIEHLLFLYVLFFWTPSMALMGLQFCALFNPFLKRLILKKPIYSHVYFGLFLLVMSASFIVLFIEMLVFFDTPVYEINFNLFVIFLAAFLKSCRLVYQKWMYKHFRSSQFRLNGLEGLYAFIAFTIFQVFLAISNSPSFSFVAEIFEVTQTWEQIRSLLIIFLLGAGCELLRSSWSRKRHTNSNSIEFFVISICVFAELKIDYFELDGDAVEEWSVVVLFRYFSYFVFMIGCLIIDENLEIRKWNLSADLKKYQTKNYSDDKLKIAEEFSIMNI